MTLNFSLNSKYPNLKIDVEVFSKQWLTFKKYARINSNEVKHKDDKYVKIIY